MKKIFLSIIIIIILTITSIQKGLIFAEETDSESSESIKQKVVEKIEKAKNSPKAFFGSVTDKTRNGIEIQTAKGGIQNISVDEENISVSNSNKKPSNVGYDDVAIGDFIIAMGFINDKKILEVKRILITSPIEEPKRRIIKAKVVSIVKKDITVSNQDNDNQIFTFPKKWNGPEINEIQESDDVIIVFEESEGKNLIRTIKLIKKDPSPIPQETETPTAKTTPN